ncbi:hypothetical protein GCM10007352_08390 [Mucilaginibacter phyllosphaerae]|uniref:Uncharacterized protein n=1 Tax=Mucilaginibacter phyllosphaerae TaxID=1812349 RepID=A0ABR6IDL8_9SPHI|nr:hypothetical protein [Mucilaginibacter phyllosphaerae]GGH04896.1 hypothetical protein GCM10007352_08390 [Mucilaginibacter phyllosphaerae]
MDEFTGKHFSKKWNLNIRFTPEAEESFDLDAYYINCSMFYKINEQDIVIICFWDNCQ